MGLTDSILTLQLPGTEVNIVLTVPWFQLRLL